MNQPSPRQRWSKSFADPSGVAFAAIVSPGVTLEGSIFALPVHGREAVWRTLRTASEIYNYVRIQVLTNAGALDRRKQLAVVERLLLGLIDRHRGRCARDETV
jgi:hypothetical protein